MNGSDPGPVLAREAAPAKVNLVLHVGPRRADGLHELCSLFASTELADEVVVRESGHGRDEVSTPGVEGEDLCARALAAYRAAAGESVLPPVALTVEKRIPIAAGLGGGSADAAATLRTLDRLTGGALGVEELRRLGARLGADVPSQIEPRHALVTGAGEHVEPLSLAPLALVLVPQELGLSTAEVYAEADRIGATRDRLDPAPVREVAAMPAVDLARAVENDLESAALSLRPALAETIRALTEAGALAAFVTGSGPTVVGLFAAGADAGAAAAALPGAIATATR